MIKSLMIASALCVALAVPAFAGANCEDKDAWAAAETEVNAMAAGADKDAALAEWKLSGGFKQAGNLGECNTHMAAAMDQAGKQKSKKSN